jgi:hypothetical protein
LMYGAERVHYWLEFILIQYLAAMRQLNGRERATNP